MHKTEIALAAIGLRFIGGFRTRRLNTTRNVFGTKWGKPFKFRDTAPYPHSSTRQQARYARQIAAAKLTKNNKYGRTKKAVAHV